MSIAVTLSLSVFLFQSETLSPFLMRCPVLLPNCRRRFDIQAGPPFLMGPSIPILNGSPLNL